MIAVEQVAAAVEVVESRGQWWVRSVSGHRGVMQIHPRWAQVPAAWLWIPEVNRAEGRRLLVYWRGKAHGRWPYALAAYRCGWAGLKGECGLRYARKVLAVVRTLPDDV